MSTIIFENKSKLHVIFLTLVVLLILAIGKDLVHSSIKDYHFYLSESMLFGIFWPLFIPFILLKRKILKNCPRFSFVLSPFLVTIVHIAFFSFLVYIISLFFLDHVFSFTHIFIDSSVDYGISCLLFYSAVSFILFKIKLPEREEREFRTKPAKIRVSHQKRLMLISSNDIIYVKTDRPYIALVTNKRTYLFDSSLKKFNEEYLPTHFLQIHKSTIINTDCIQSYQSRNNGDYDVLMDNGDIVRASRNYNAYFKTPAKSSAQIEKNSS